MTDQNRADFEAHFGLTTRQKMMRHHDGSYVYADIQAKWEGYQAGVAAVLALKRYDGYCSYDGGGPAIMEESPDGQYVLFDDITRLLR